MKLNFKSVGKPAIILIIICVCVSALLGVTNLLTKDTIIKSQSIKEEQSRKIVLETADSFEQVEDYYIGKSGTDTVGYVFVTESKGYGGTIKVMTGISVQSKITGVVILSQNETPGLGANAANESFTSGFKQDATELQVAKNTPSGGGKIGAMTGATITTDAVTAAVNQAVSAFENVKGGK